MRKLKKTDYTLDLKKIYTQLIAKEVDNSEFFLFDDFMEAYHLNENQIRVLAFLYHHNPMVVSRERLISFTDNDRQTEENDLESLIRRKFLQPRFFEQDGFYYQISSDAVNAFAEGQPFGTDFFIDCTKLIKDATPKDISSSEWETRLYDACLNEKNSRFAAGMEKFGVKNLEKDTRVAFWTLMNKFLNCFTVPYAFRKDTDDESNLVIGHSELKCGMSDLVKKGLAETLPVEPLEDTHDTDRFVISPKVIEVFFKGMDELVRYDDISRVANVIVAKDIAEKQLFFSEESQKEVDNLRRVLSVEGFQRAKGILARQKRNPAVLSLFWGPPGTGKTEVIKQIARETGRDLILFDAAKITASAWGAAEKNYRALFLGYRFLEAICENEPILLLNECDQVLSKRLSSIERAIDKSENTLSNILLQSFEDMSGILLATTNLATNLDEAFDRRFLFKTELRKPDARARKSIWKSLIPELKDSEATSLADRFEMTGAQISNVVAKRDLAELYYDGDRGYQYLAELCKTEYIEPIKGSSSRRIGF